MNVAEKIKNIVTDKGVTYTRISQKTGLSVDVISKALRGDRKLNADEMILICNAAEIDLHDLKDSA